MCVGGGGGASTKRQGVGQFKFYPYKIQKGGRDAKSFCHAEVGRVTKSCDVV